MFFGGIAPVNAKKGKQRMNARQVDFATFCIGSVASSLGMGEAEVYRRLKDSGILMDYIVPCYDVLHTFSREYIVEDLIGLMRKKGVLQAA